MQNKYLYALLNDLLLQIFCIFSVIGAVFCVILIRLDVWQTLELKDIHDKQALIAQIPSLQSEIVQLKTGIKDLVLNGIISDKAQPMAVINNRLVKAGGMIEGKKVISIMDHGVTVCNMASNKCVMLFLKK